MKELNTHYNLYNRRATNAPPLAVHRVKVTFKDEPGEGTGVTRSFYTAIAEVCCIIIEITLVFYFKNINIYIYIFFFLKALLANEKLPNLEAAQVGSKYTQYNVLRKLKSRDRDHDLRRQVNIIIHIKKEKKLKNVFFFVYGSYLITESSIFWKMSRDT